MLSAEPHIDFLLQMRKMKLSGVLGVVQVTQLVRIGARTPTHWDSKPSWNLLWLKKSKTAFKALLDWTEIFQWQLPEKVPEWAFQTKDIPKGKKSNTRGVWDLKPCAISNTTSPSAWMCMIFMFNSFLHHEWSVILIHHWIPSIQPMPDT